LGPRKPLGARKGALLGPRGTLETLEDRTMSNCCIKEKKEERKMRGAREGPYLDPKGALRGPQQVPQGTPSGYLGASIRALSGPNSKL
jgi:hypothetical protein